MTRPQWTILTRCSENDLTWVALCPMSSTVVLSEKCISAQTFITIYLTKIFSYLEAIFMVYLKIFLVIVKGNNHSLALWINTVTRRERTLKHHIITIYNILRAQYKAGSNILLMSGMNSEKRNRNNMGIFS